MHDEGRSPIPPRVEYADLKRRRVPDTPTLASEIRRLVQDLTPALPDRKAPRTDGGNRLEEIAEIWRRTVGEEVAALSRPIRFRQGVLTVEVDSAPLAAELGSFAREHLKEALVTDGLEKLCELRFRSGKVSP